MLWMSGASLRWLSILAAAAIAMVPIAWTYILRDYQKAAPDVDFLDPHPDIQGAGYQLYQAQIAVGSGGFVGKGLTNGTQTQGDFLPVQATDFVFATLAEELGFIGGLSCSSCSCLLLWRVLVAGWRSRDAFGTLFAAGVASMILFQLVVNVGMVHRDHADHRHPAAVRDPRRRIAREHGRRARDPAEHQHPAIQGGVVAAKRGLGNH